MNKWPFYSKKLGFCQNFSTNTQTLPESVLIRRPGDALSPECTTESSCLHSNPFRVYGTLLFLSLWFGLFQCWPPLDSWKMVKGCCSREFQHLFLSVFQLMMDRSFRVKPKWRLANIRELGSPRSQRPDMCLAGFGLCNVKSHFTLSASMSNTNEVSKSAMSSPVPDRKAPSMVNSDDRAQSEEYDVWCR